MKIALSQEVETKLEAVNEAVGKACQIIHDPEVDYWYVFFITQTNNRGQSRYERRNVGSGTSVESALDDALRGRSAGG